MLQTVFKRLSGLKPMIISTRNYEPTVIKDVYKLYQHNMKKYEDDEKCEILDFVNCAESAEKLELCIPKAKAAKLFKHKTQNGPFKLIEQFLDVRGLQVKHIEKFSDKILKGPESIEESKAKQLEKKLKNHTIPILQPEFTKTLDIVGFKFDLRGMSYAHITNEKLNSWAHWQPEEPLIVKSSFDHHNLGLCFLSKSKKKCRGLKYIKKIVFIYLKHGFIKNEPLIS